MMVTTTASVGAHGEAASPTTTPAPTRTEKIVLASGSVGTAAGLAVGVAWTMRAMAKLPPSSNGMIDLMTKVITGAFTLTIPAGAGAAAGLGAGYLGAKLTD